MVLDNLKMSFKIKHGDGDDGQMKQTWISVISQLHTMPAVYISTAR
jgi:hypothetical protein